MTSKSSAPFDAFTVYCQHQIERGFMPPSREWWDMACAKRLQADCQRDHDDERRDGWAA